MCDEDLCPGMLSCNGSECGCKENYIKVAGSLCIYTDSHSFLAQSDAGGNLPENLYIGFIGKNDTIEGPIGQYKTHELSYNAPEYNRSGGTFTTYSKASFPPEGVTNDRFRLFMPYPVYPAGVGGGYCDLRIEGIFVHPDTIETTVWYNSCNPQNMPEANNTYRVKFIRIKPE